MFFVFLCFFFIILATTELCEKYSHDLCVCAPIKEIMLEL